LTQHELAQRLNSTQSVVARWEQGEHDFKVETISRIADALGVEIRVRFGKKGARA